MEPMPSRQGAGIAQGLRVCLHFQEMVPMLIAHACVERCDPDTAARRIAAALRLDERGPPSWVTVHHGAALAAEPLRHALASALAGDGAAVLHGSSSCLGVMSGDGTFIATGDGAGALAIWDSAGDYGVGTAEIGDDPRTAGAAAAKAAMDDAGRPGEAPDLVWLTAAPGAEEALLEGIQDVLGTTTPIVGASAADNDVSGNWTVFDRQQTLRAGVVVSALYPSRPVVSALQSGYAPTGLKGVATRAKGRTLFEIDARPARAVLSEWIGSAIVTPTGGDVSILGASSWTPLGRETQAVAGVPFHLLTHPATARADGGVDLFAALRQGETLHQMRGSPDSLATRAGRLARLVKEDDRLSEGVAGALVVFCGGSMLAMRDRMDEVVGGLRAAFGDTPFLGVFSFGEQGTTLAGENVHGNLMISCTAFGSR
jgi:hypothetical protein